MIASIIGYVALILNLYSMTLKGEFKLRLFSAIANSIYVLYGILIHAFPIIIGAAIAVVLHTLRIIKLKKGNDDRN